VLFNAALLDEPVEERQRGRRRGLAEEAFAARQPHLGRDDLGVGRISENTARLVARGGRALPRGWVADANRRGNRLWLVDGMAVDDGRGAVGLRAGHAAKVLRQSFRLALAEALPVGGDVACI